jgi:hypothetical protein
MPSTEQADLLVRNGMAEYPNPVKSIETPPAAKVLRSPRAKK